MEKKNTKTIIIAILIVLLGIGIWSWLNKKAGVGTVTLPGGGEVSTQGQACWLPLPKYTNMTKFIEQKDEKAGTFFAMYGIQELNKAEEIKDFYKTKAAEEGWTLGSDMFMEQTWILDFSKGQDYSLQVSVGYMDNSTQLSLSCSGPGTEEKENPYDSVSQVNPGSSLGNALHNDFKAVFNSIFGGAKLTRASSDKWVEELTYIVKRQTTEQDAQQIRSLLEQRGYGVTSSSSRTDKYNYTFSKEILGEEYDDINVTIWLTEEGSTQQKITVSVYK